MIFMTLREDIDNTLKKMILSASGWRGVFAFSEDEESKTDKISEAHRVIAGAAAHVFADYLRSPFNISCSQCKPLVLLGTDTRPTGKAIIEAMIPVLLNHGCEVRYTGVAAAPEIMAWARTKEQGTGFIYVSASHNPIGHNGLKFGLTDGGVLAADEANKLITSFRAFINNDDNIAKIDSFVSGADPLQLKNVYGNIDNVKPEALKAYHDFCEEVMQGGTCTLASTMKDNLEKKPLGIVCDFNGSARTMSIDKEFLTMVGFKFKCINSGPGDIVHRIVPEGESLEPCARLLEEAHSDDASFVLGYVPDCDGDRGNLVIFDTAAGKARPLEAQEVFALACVAEFSHLVWAEKIPAKAAVAINDPTSMRIDRIAKAFGISTFRAEVGEANVVTLARKLREDGYIVRILGEGSAGGNITHPSAVRDPVNTVLAIAKMLSIRTIDGKSGLFEIWCKCSNQTDKYREDFSITDIIASLPPFVTTPAYNEDAVMRIKTHDHAALKSRYQEVFLREWEARRDQFKKCYGFNRWEAIAYNGTEEKRGIKSFGEAGKGGLKVLFFDSEGKETAYIWMRGSATEPVFRIMADVEGADNQAERDLLNWHRRMIIEADRSSCSETEVLEQLH